MSKEIRFCYPSNGEIKEDINYYRKKNNKDENYIDLSDANKSDYIYDAIRCVLLYDLKSTRRQETLKLLDDIKIFKKHIYIVSVEENYKNFPELIESDLEIVYIQSMDISTRFNELFRGDKHAK